MATFAVERQNVDLGTLEPLRRTDVQGHLIVKDGRPGDSIPPGIRVDIIPWEMRMMFTYVRSGEVDPNGRFAVSDAFLGEHGVQVSGLTAGYYVIGASQKDRNVLERGLWPGDGELRITLGADGPIVTGRVLSADGTAIQDASVLLVPQGSGQHLVSQSDQTGTYQFTTGVRPGKYRLAAASDLTRWQRQDTAAAARLAANGMELELSPRASRVVDLRIPPAR